MTTGTFFDLKQLEAFAAVISTGSVTGAARMIGKSQPMVTRLIQDLEAEIGFALFARHGRRITPTQNGTLFYREVDRLLADAGRTRARALALAQRQIQSVELVATATMAAGIVPKALAILRGRGIHPPQIVVRVKSSEEVIQAVASRAADVGISSLPLDHPGLEVHWIAESPCICALREDDPLAQKAEIALSDLAGVPLITLLNPYRVSGRIAAALEEAKVDIGAQIKTNSSGTAMSMVREGLGVAVLEPIAGLSALFSGTVIRPLKTNIPYLWGAVTPIGLPESPVTQPLVEALLEASQAGPTQPVMRDLREMEGILKNMSSE